LPYETGRLQLRAAGEQLNLACERSQLLFGQPQATVEKQLHVAAAQHRAAHGRVPAAIHAGHRRVTAPRQEGIQIDLQIYLRGAILHANIRNGWHGFMSLRHCA
jgi:hypothetical protein